MQKKINRISWSFENELWFNILVIPSTNKKMMTGKESIRCAGMVISYIVMGRYMKKEDIESVREIIRNARNDQEAKLPEMV